jgi:hypothetical protein
MMDQQASAPNAAAPLEAPAGPLEAPAGPLTEKINWPYHAILGVAAGLVAVFTALAWPFAILTGVVIGRSEAERQLGRRGGVTILRVLAVTGGVLAMLIAGALIGGLISFLIAALMAFSERISARANDTDRTMARLVTILITVITWIVVIAVLRLNVSLNFGGPPPA